jgi:hypothetical protein
MIQISSRLPSLVRSCRATGVSSPNLGRTPDKFRLVPRDAPMEQMIPGPATSAGSFAAAEPLTYSIDPALGVVFVDLLEADNARRVVLALQGIRLDLMFGTGLHACIDCHYLRTVPGPNCVGAIAELTSRIDTDSLSGRVAIVGASSNAYASAHLFVVFARATASRFRVFQTHRDALLWLIPKTGGNETNCSSTKHFRPILGLDNTRSLNGLSVR